MPDLTDDFDERLVAAAVRLEQEAAVRSPAGVRARGDQRRRRHTATMAVVPVAVLAIAGSVGVAVQPFGGSSRHHVTGVAPAGTTTSSASATSGMPTPPSTKAEAGLMGIVDLGHHTLTVRDAQGKTVRTLGITAGRAAYPTRMGTFTVVDKQPSKKLTSPPVNGDSYNLTVYSFIDLGSNAPAIYAAPWAASFIGKEDSTHGDIELSPNDATWLSSQLAVGDTIQVVSG